MQFLISEQVNVFFMSVLCGAIIGVINEPFRFLRHIGFESKVGVFIQDVLFMSIIAFVSFFFSLCYNKGEIRLFILLGEFCGFLIFRYTLGLLTGRLFSIIRLLLMKIYTFFNKINKALSTIMNKIFAILLVKLPLLKNSKETPCQRGENYCIILKSVFRSIKALKKR